VVEAALHPAAEVVARAAVVPGLGALRVPSLARSGEVAERGARILHCALDCAALAGGKTLLGLGPQRPLGVGDAVALAVALDRRRALPPALVAPAPLGARAEGLREVDRGLVLDVLEAGLHAARDLAREGLGAPSEGRRQIPLPALPVLQRGLERRQRPSDTGFLGVKPLLGLLGALERRAQVASLIAARAGETPKAEVIEALGESLLVSCLGVEGAPACSRTIARETSPPTPCSGG
jgi:hypothetical protein